MMTLRILFGTISSGDKCPRAAFNNKLNEVKKRCCAKGNCAGGRLGMLNIIKTSLAGATALLTEAWLSSEETSENYRYSCLNPLMTFGLAGGMSCGQLTAELTPASWAQVVCRRTARPTPGPSFD